MRLVVVLRQVNDYGPTYEVQATAITETRASDGLIHACFAGGVRLQVFQVPEVMLVFAGATVRLTKGREVIPSGGSIWRTTVAKLVNMKAVLGVGRKTSHRALYPHFVIFSHERKFPGRSVTASGLEPNVCRFAANSSHVPGRWILTSSATRATTDDDPYRPH